MKLFTLLFTVAVLLALPTAAQIVYENGPINGNTDAWTINLGFDVSDTFTISTGTTTVTGMSFGAWLTPGDTLQSVGLSLTSDENGGTVYFQGQVPVTQSGCVLNSYSFDVCTEIGSFAPTMFNNGTYWVNLQNAIDSQGDPVYWDENSGVGCHSPGCPSQAGPGGEGTMPSEAFSILGTTSSSTSNSVPEPSSLMLFATGVLGVGALVRRKLF
jgi:hypothetical protein